MTTKGLIQEQSEIYKGLFKYNDIVVSSPFSLDIIGNQKGIIDYAWQYHKIPFRIYVGIKKISGKGVQVAIVKEYDHFVKQFVSSSAGEWEHDKVLMDAISNIVGSQGISISILCELPMHYGIGGEKTVRDLVICACSRLFGDKVNTKEAQDLDFDQYFSELPLDIALIYSGSPSFSKVDEGQGPDNQEGCLITNFLCKVQSVIANKFAENKGELRDACQFIKNLHIISSIQSDYIGIKPYCDLLLQEMHKLLADVVHSIGGNPYSRGCYIITAPTHYLKSKASDLSNLVGAHGGAVLYYGAVDGFEKQGLLIEYFPSQGIMHPILGDCVIRVQDNQNSVAVYDNIEQSVDKYDILVDIKQGKLFMGGQKLSSLELLSQQYTASVFERHIFHNVKSIPSNTLPISSYSKSKSEFMGKIGYPLQKCIQDKVGKTFSIKCDGSGSSFVAHVDYDNISIGCVID